MVLKRKQMAKLIFAAILALSIAVAQTPPDLSGSWKCNIEKSDWGASSPPPDLTLKIKHKEPEMVTAQIIGGQTEEFRFVTDGRENVNNFSQGTLKTRMKWEKGVLAMESKLGEGEVTLSDRLALSSDGKTIRMTRHMKGPDGETDWALVLEKQD